MTDTNQLPPMPTPKFTETIRGVPCITVTEHEHLIRAYALQARGQVQGELEPYAAGLLNDFGGGNVEWWQDYIRAELGRAHDFYQSQITTPQPAQATQADVTDAEIVAVMRDGNNCNYNDEAEHIQFARAILSLRPERVPMTDEQVDSFRVDGRLHWLGKRQLIRAVEAHHDITTQAKKETP